MKKFLLIFILFIPFLTTGQYIPDTIFAEVNGSTVKIYDQEALRICTYVYDHKVILEENILEWRQYYAGGEPVYCVCNFDYMVEVGPLSPGEYAVDVYYEDLEWLYIGSTIFIIENGARADTLELISSSSSGCYWVGNDETISEQTISVSPNPATDHVNFSIDYPGEMQISVYNMNGERIYSSEKFTKNSFRWNIDAAVNPGLYSYRVKSDSFIYSGKIQLVK